MVGFGRLCEVLLYEEVYKINGYREKLVEVLGKQKYNEVEIL